MNPCNQCLIISMCEVSCKGYEEYVTKEVEKTVYVTDFRAGGLTIAQAIKSVLKKGNRLYCTTKNHGNIIIRYDLKGNITSVGKENY